MNGPSAAVAARGQTTIDFVIGVSVFLVTIAFVVAFVPQITAPYQDQDQPVVGERVASTLAEDLLADRGPSVLDTTCTIAFLTQDDTAATNCPFDPDDSLSDQIGVETGPSVNVTLQRDVSAGPEREVLCADSGSIEACGTDRLAVGQPVPTEKRSVSTARRTVFVDGKDAVLEVTVW